MVRLKGGDPFVFGRGDDEVRYLAEQGIPWEVIPGPSSCTAAPTAAGYPLTRRAVGRSFAVATARIAGGAVPQSFPRADSLVILMGAAILRLVVPRLLSEGWPSDTPATLIERGTLPWERRVAGKLAEIAALAETADVVSPALLIVGCAAAPLPAMVERPRILFTGLDPANFRALGDLLHWPALKIVPDEEGRRLIPWVLGRLRRRGFDWIVFASRLAVTSFFAALARAGPMPASSPERELSPPTRASRSACKNISCGLMPPQTCPETPVGPSGRPAKGCWRCTETTCPVKSSAGWMKSAPW